MQLCGPIGELYSRQCDTATVHRGSRRHLALEFLKPYRKSNQEKRRAEKERRDLVRGSGKQNEIIEMWKSLLEEWGLRRARGLQKTAAGRRTLMRLVSDI